MPPLLPPSDVKAALDEFNSWGAVVEHYLFVAPTMTDIHAHQLTARAGLNAALQTVDASRLITENSLRWTPQQFFGPCYEVDTDVLLMRGESNDFINYYFREGQQESRATAISPSYLENIFPPDTQWSAVGYAQALFEPPYRLYKRIGPPTNREVAAAFRRLCDALFGDLTTLEIYQWPTDCSNYFDAGHEWWGSFFWTVYAPSKNWIVTILASSTD